MDEKNLNMGGHALGDNELEQAVGGSGGTDTRTIGGVTFSGHVGKYNGVIGNFYYVTIDGEDEWYYGRLDASFEEDNIILGIKVGTNRKHIVQTTERNGQFYSGTLHVYGDDVTLYTTRS